MSINVTVSGNPISIKRGTMVTADPDFAKKEFDKRRLMRLEQVRQQSKDIAENVRNKVRREKKKQLDQIEQDGKEKLKNWQNRKLLELQTQYKEAIKELGVGHKEAQALEDESEIFAEEKERNDEIAEQRGRAAAAKLQIQKNQENLKRAIPIQQKKLVRDLENTRATLVSNIKKKKNDIVELNKKQKKRRRASADINITVPDSSTDNESDYNCVSQDNEECVEEGSSPVSCDCTVESEQPREPLDLNKNNLVSNSTNFEQPMSISDQDITENLRFSKDANRRTVNGKFQENVTKFGPPFDTRISDRIRRRKLLASLPDYCDVATDSIPIVGTGTRIKDVIDSHPANRLSAEPEFASKSIKYVDIDKCNCSQMCICKKNQIKSSFIANAKSAETHQLFNRPKNVATNQEIPTKPHMKLRQSGNIESKCVSPSKVTVASSDSNKVQFYDHSNRFLQEKEYPSNVYVEKITNDSIEVIPNAISEAEWYEKMKQRDKEAQIRGQKALMKEKIQKDYEEMLKKLPLLQKKERILEINKDKPEYHMSEERLKEQERIRKNQLENAYNKKYSNLKPAIVTLPRKNHTREPTKILETEPIQSLNVGKWDVDFKPKTFTVEEVQEIIHSFTEQEPKDRRAKLKELLRSLKVQKQQLINELKSLTNDDSINDLINDLHSFSDNDEIVDHKTKRKHRERKRRHEGNESSNDSTADSTSSSTMQERIGSTKNKQKNGHRCEIGKTPSPRKKAKMKSRKKVLVLQNMSTQTTPKSVNVHSEQEKLKELPKTSPKVSKHVCDKIHIPCDCNKENVRTTDELCQILIKINENDTPEVIVKSKSEGKTPMEAAISSGVISKSKFKSVGVGTDDSTRDTEEKFREATATSVKQPQQPVAEVKESMRKSKSESKTQKDDFKRDVLKQIDSKAGKGKKVKPVVTHSSKIDDKSKSWREHFSKNSISTSSTSYFSPPDFQRTKDSQVFSTYTEQSQSFYNLHKKPQQGNVHNISAALSLSQSQSSSESRTVDPKLLVYIKKLLSSSRLSIENLSVSTSSVQTPTQSIIEMESNNPMAKLHNIIKQFNLRVEDVARDLSFSTDSSHIHYNSSASASDLSQNQVTKENLGAHSTKTDKPEKDTSINMTKSKETILSQYADITDSCSKRIAHLADMIKQIREEKIQMLHCTSAQKNLEKSKVSPTGSEKDYSTAYLELPQSGESSKHSSGISLDDEELQRRLMEIDLSLANKLRKFPLASGELASEDTCDNAGSTKDKDDLSTTDKELWMRLHRLMQQNTEAAPISNTEIVPEKTTHLTGGFVPFLSDIPRLPKLEAQSECIMLDSHKRPPPSKGLTIVKKFNGNISLIPHELSTIVEADSQLSAKVSSSHISPNSSKISQVISPHKDLEFIIPEEDEGNVMVSSSTSKKSEEDQCQAINQLQSSLIDVQKEQENTQNKSLSPLYVSLKEANRSLICDDLSAVKSTSTSKSLKMSSSSSDDIETIESMLKSIGMGWAIATLRKTQDALALTSSSSSSLELQSKNKLNSESSSTEISLREFLRKQMLNKVSSSTLKSDASPVSLLAEFSDISAIQGNSSAEKGRHRTSTPVTSKSTTKSRGSGKDAVFTAHSDISYVREDTKSNSDKHSYHSLSECSQSKIDE